MHLVRLKSSFIEFLNFNKRRFLLWLQALRCLLCVDDQSNGVLGCAARCARLQRCENYKRPVMAVVIVIDAVTAVL